MSLRWSLYRYDLPLTMPLSLATGTFTERSGVLVHVQDEEGHEGWGDIAPLPGFSTESLEDALVAARAVIAGGRVDGFASRQVTSSDDFTGLPFDPHVPPSVRAGVDLALADLFAQRRGLSLARYLTPRPATHLSLNALLLGSRDGVLRGAATARRQGYDAVKLKVGRQAVPADVALVRAVHERLGPAVELRLDANRAWTLEAAQTFAAGIQDIPISYIEEPLADPAELHSFVESTGLPLALDETVQETTSENIERGAFAVAVVLKPTLLGGVGAIHRWTDMARALGMRPVFSAAFESGVGLRHLMALAAAFGAAETAVGFDTYRWLAEDVLERRLPLEQPHLDVERALGQPPRVRKEHLRRV